MPFCQIPVLKKIIFINVVPFHQGVKGSLWKTPINYPRKNFNGDFIVAILCVKMRRAVIIVKHGNDYTKKSAEFRHVVSFPLFVYVQQ